MGSEVVPPDAYDICSFCGRWMIEHGKTQEGDLVHPTGDGSDETQALKDKRREEWLEQGSEHG